MRLLICTHSLFWEQFFFLISFLIYYPLFSFLLSLSFQLLSVSPNHYQLSNSRPFLCTYHHRFSSYYTHIFSLLLLGHAFNRDTAISLSLWTCHLMFLKYSFRSLKSPFVSTIWSLTQPEFLFSSFCSICLARVLSYFFCPSTSFVFYDFPSCIIIYLTYICLWMLFLLCLHFSLLWV